MKLHEIVEKLSLKVWTENADLDSDVKTGYASDLLSDVMANALEGSLWVTLQVHQNIVAVAVLKSLSGIVFVNGREPEEATLKKANEEGLAIMTTELSMFEVVGRLYGLGVAGS